MGQALALESNIEADDVTGVPDSGIGAAMGYAKASGIPYVSGIIKTNKLGVHLLHNSERAGKYGVCKA